jgi:DNA-binding GntR family transcriptional regulator
MRGSSWSTKTAALRDTFDARAALEASMVARLAVDREPAVIAELEDIVANEAQTVRVSRRPSC